MRFFEVSFLRKNKQKWILTKFGMPEAGFCRLLYCTFWAQKDKTFKNSCL